MEYSVLLEGQKLGVILLQEADPSNGFAFGKLKEQHPDTLGLVKNHCEKNGIVFEHDESANFLATYCIPALQLRAEDSQEALGFPSYFEGIDDDLNIIVMDIPHPFYTELLSR